MSLSKILGGLHTYEEASYGYLSADASGTVYTRSHYSLIIFFFKNDTVPRGSGVSQ